MQLMTDFATDSFLGAFAVFMCGVFGWVIVTKWVKWHCATVVGGKLHFKKAVQLVDVDAMTLDGGSEAPPPARKPPRPPSIFTVDGEPLVALGGDAASPALAQVSLSDAAADARAGEEAFVWDVYAPFGAAPGESMAYRGEPVGLVSLSAPVFGDYFENCEDIDDSESGTDFEYKHRGFGRSRGCGGSSSSGSDAEDTRDIPWSQVLD
eukprot:TRINITY_DN16322_c0_g1_i1.p1 TRINITY_DN16322_c0_g1~~TRINITY_DN16322_c0_g1_i1.p1  ORF type:complete len:208 (-),score=58.00 TRINITY_DN16322_c0_g1_i1:171-794(-)